jgi:hypothetical protein
MGLKIFNTNKIELPALYISVAMTGTISILSFWEDGWVNTLHSPNIKM